MHFAILLFFAAAAVNAQFCSQNVTTYDVHHRAVASVFHVNTDSQFDSLTFEVPSCVDRASIRYTDCAASCGDAGACNTSSFTSPLRVCINPHCIASNRTVFPMGVIIPHEEGNIAAGGSDPLLTQDPADTCDECVAGATVSCPVARRTIESRMARRGVCGTCVAGSSTKVIASTVDDWHEGFGSVFEFETELTIWPGEAGASVHFEAVNFDTDVTVSDAYLQLTASQAFTADLRIYIQNEPNATDPIDDPRLTGPAAYDI